MENDIATLKIESEIVTFYGRLTVDYSSLFDQESIACGYGLSNDTDRQMKELQVYTTH